MERMPTHKEKYIDELLLRGEGFENAAERRKFNTDFYRKQGYAGKVPGALSSCLSTLYKKLQQGEVPLWAQASPDYSVKYNRAIDLVRNRDGEGEAQQDGDAEEREPANGQAEAEEREQENYDIRDEEAQAGEEHGERAHVVKTGAQLVMDMFKEHNEIYDQLKTDLFFPYVVQIAPLAPPPSPVAGGPAAAAPPLQRGRPSLAGRAARATTPAARAARGTTPAPAAVVPPNTRSRSRSVPVVREAPAAKKTRRGK